MRPRLDGRYRLEGFGVGDDEGCRVELKSLPQGKVVSEAELPELPDLPEEPSPAIAAKNTEGFTRAITMDELSFVRWLKSGGAVLKLHNCWGGPSGNWGWHFTVALEIDSQRRATIKKVEKKDIFYKS